jgi:hypothetical protein
MDNWHWNNDGKVYALFKIGTYSIASELWFIQIRNSGALFYSSIILGGIRLTRIRSVLVSQKDNPVSLGAIQ